MKHDLVALLAERGVAPGTPVQLMRHAGGRYPLYRYRGTHALTIYQAVQRRAMKAGTLIVAFFGNRAGHGLLLGVWRVDSFISTTEARRCGLLDGAFEAADEMAG